MADLNRLVAGFARRALIVALVAAALSATAHAQSAAAARVAGCYELSVGPWTPAADSLPAPAMIPARFALDTLEFPTHPRMPGVQPMRVTPARVASDGWPAVWSVRGAGDSVIVTWPEQWRTDGTKLRTLTREAPWFPKGAPIAAGRPGIDVPPPPGVGGILVDSAGLLYVVIGVPNQHWQPRGRGSSAATRDPNTPPPEPFDAYIDVIDPHAGVVLASAGPMSFGELRRLYSVEIFRGTSRGYRLGETADGLSAARIVEFRLVAR